MSMGVYIKGMEMPKSCESCPCKTADAFGGLGCQATGYIPLRKANQDRPDNCPLVPVPPHGRLIDGDKLAEEQKENVGAYHANLITLDDLAECLLKQSISEDYAPTIIPAEEGE
jgi:hypothetical protein